jgi:AraC family transcriptional regulator of adaptative response/methylated-DNA-[protein]-cysteine methyltransferase
MFFDLPDAAEQAGFRACLRCEPRQTRALDPQVALVQRVCRFLDASQTETVKLADVAAHAGVSAFHLQRTFKRIMGISPRQYLTARRFGNFKTLVREGEPVTQALYDSGFNSSSRVYEHAPEELGMTPATYGRGGQGTNISYTVVASALGGGCWLRRRNAASVRCGWATLTMNLKTICAPSFPREHSTNDAALREPVKKILSHSHE